MMRIASILLVPLLAAFTGCASLPEPLAKEYDGPSAKLLDTWQNSDGAKAEFFAVLQVDGTPVANALSNTRAASYGKGSRLIPMGHVRFVAVRPMRLHLIGTHVTAMPIHEAASRIAGTFHEVEGVVSFEPKPNVSYAVRGKLSRTGSSVWIEDQGTGEVVVSVQPK